MIYDIQNFIETIVDNKIPAILKEVGGYRCKLEYLTIVGSHAYKLADENSDIDLMGFFSQESEYVTRNKIELFDQSTQIEVIKRKLDYNGVPVEVTLFDLARFCRLCCDGSPNVIEALFTTDDCQLFKSDAAKIIVENRTKFLTQKCIPRFIGYARSSFQKVENSNRKELVEKYGYDIKSAISAVRILQYLQSIVVNKDFRVDGGGFALLSQIKYENIGLEKFNQQFEQIFKHVIEKTEEKRRTLPEICDEEQIRRLLRNILDASVDGYRP